MAVIQRDDDQALAALAGVDAAGLGADHDRRDRDADRGTAAIGGVDRTADRLHDRSRWRWDGDDDQRLSCPGLRRYTLACGHNDFPLRLVQDGTLLAAVLDPRGPPSPPPAAVVVGGPAVPLLGPPPVPSLGYPAGGGSWHERLLIASFRFSRRRSRRRRLRAFQPALDRHRHLDTGHRAAASSTVEWSLSGTNTSEAR